jgi:hypothetical protein
MARKIFVKRIKLDFDKNGEASFEVDREEVRKELLEHSKLHTMNYKYEMVQVDHYVMVFEADTKGPVPKIGFGK